MIEQKTFKIKSLPDYEFRSTKLSAIEMLAFNSTIDFNNISNSKESFTFILEHIEVNIKGSWTLVKEKGFDVYCPESLNTNLYGLQELCLAFMNEVVKPLFQKSEELS